MHTYNTPSETKKDSGNHPSRCSIQLKPKKIGCLSIALRNTSDFEEYEIWTAVEEIMSHISFRHLSKVDLTVTNRYRDRFRGKCYGNGCNMHSPDPSTPLIIARITPEENQFPYWTDRRPLVHEKLVVKDGRHVVESRKVSAGGYISCWLLDRMECLLYVLSHEFCHLWQMEHKRGRVWGARGTFSDRDADAFAIRMVRKYRKLTLREISGTVLSSASVLFSLPLATNKQPSPAIDEDIKSKSLDSATEDHLISLLHLENQSNLQSFVKDRCYDYETLEQYLYSDIIPEECVRRSSATETGTKEEDYSL